MWLAIFESYIYIYRCLFSSLFVYIKFRRLIDSNSITTFAYIIGVTLFQRSIPNSVRFLLVRYTHKIPEMK